jgi:hypothetical protein
VTGVCDCVLIGWKSLKWLGLRLKMALGKLP